MKRFNANEMNVLFLICTTLLNICSKFILFRIVSFDLVVVMKKILATKNIKKSLKNKDMVVYIIKKYLEMDWDALFPGILLFLVVDWVSTKMG